MNEFRLHRGLAVILYHYRGDIPNFGDELNEWLFPRLLPAGFFDNSPDTLFLGIGSVLFDTHPATQRKLVFGSGYGGYTAKPRIDANWDIRFVRGRMTASALGLDPRTAVGDAAILLSTMGLRRTPVPGRRVFMPHVDGVSSGAWADIAAEAGLYYLDPSLPVARVLETLLSAETVVTEALHGAIVADTLRVPWIAMRPIFPVHRAKWDDWASVLNLELRWHRHFPSNLCEALMLAAGGRRYATRRIRWYMRNLSSLGSSSIGAIAVRALRNAAAQEPQLSRDSDLNRAGEQMQVELGRLLAPRS